jgi:hypothetical protein
MGNLTARSAHSTAVPTGNRSPMSLDRSKAAAARLAEIDALQDDVLRRLDELEHRTAAVLAQCLKVEPAPSSPVGHDPGSQPALRREAA